MSTLDAILYNPYEPHLTEQRIPARYVKYALQGVAKLKYSPIWSKCFATHRGTDCLRRDNFVPSGEICPTCGSLSFCNCD